MSYTITKRIRTLLKCFIYVSVSLYRFVSKLTRGGPPAWRLDEGLKTPHNKKKAASTKYDTGPRAGSCVHGSWPPNNTGALGAIK